MHKVDYYEARDETSIEEGLKALYSSKNTGVLEIHTPREMNINILKDYFRFLNHHIKSD